MNFIYELIPGNVAEAIGWTIFHSLWQGALISIILGVTILTVDNKSAKFKYALAVTSLLLMFVSSIITFIKVYSPETATTFLTQDSTSVRAEFVQQAGLKEQANNSPYLFFNFVNDFKSDFINYIPWIVNIWFAGLLIFSFRFIGGLLYIQRLKTRFINKPDQFVESALKKLLASAGIKKSVCVFESALVKVPVAIGYLKPVILFPLGMILGLPQNQVEAIIAHEIAHIKRYDFIINIIQTIAETIFFYHPSAWWISAVVRFERENCCDDIAVKLCGSSLTYSKALLNIQHMKEQESSFVLAAGGNQNQLFRRIKRMNEKKKTNLSYGIKFTAFAVLALIIAVVSLYSTNTYGSDPVKVNEASFTNPFSSLNKFFANSENKSAAAETLRDTTSIRKGKRAFRFNEEKDGSRISYKAKLNNGKLEELFIDGEKIPENELGKYENKINNKINDYESVMADYRKNRDNYKKLIDEYAEKMKDYREKLKDYGSFQRHRHGDLEDFEKPDLSELREAMRDLRRELNDKFADHSFAIPPIHIPEIDIPEIEIPEIHVPPIHVPPVPPAPDFDNEKWGKWRHEFQQNMKEFQEQMKKQNLNMDEFQQQMKEYNFNMDDFNSNMKVFGKKMKIFGAEMKKFGEFMKDAKNEMIADKLVESGDDIDSFVLSENKMEVNGISVSPELRKKYLDMYEKHTGKKLEGDHKIVIND